MNWQVQEAKQRFSELVERAVAEGPQIVTKHGVPTVAVVEIDAFRRLQGRPRDFKEHLLSIPRIDDLDLDGLRDRNDVGREIDL
jgi:prevent-host-death family protein